MSQNIAFLGLGLMGAPMTANLARKGYAVKAWNRSSDRPGIKTATEAGAIVVSSVKEAVESADVIFTCVGDVPDVEEVILGDRGIVKYARSNALVIDMTTIGSDGARKIAEELQQKYQLRFLDAPVSGGDIGAINGTLTIMVGGDRKDFEESKPLFEAMGKTICLCGSVGSGQAVKMCNQALCAIHMIALCEAIAMAEHQGIDPNLIVEVCSTGAAGSWALSNLGSKIIKSDLAPAFSIKHILKDLRLIREMMQSSDCATRSGKANRNLPGIELAERLFKIVSQLDEGEGKEQGTQAMIRAYKKS
jgi:3-hydroxyisobutyrate dehydrogenase